MWCTFDLRLVNMCCTFFSIFVLLQVLYEYMRWTCCVHVVNIHVVYMWWTSGEHLVYDWWTCGEHVVYMCCTCGEHVIYMLWTCGEHLFYEWCTSGVHVVYMCCTYMRWTCGEHLVYEWSTWGVHVVSISGLSQWVSEGRCISLHFIWSLKKFFSFLFWSISLVLPPLFCLDH